MPGQNSLGLILRQPQLGVGQVIEVEQDILWWLPVNDRPHAIDPQPRVDHIARAAHALPEFVGARGNADGAAIRGALRQSINNTQRVPWRASSAAIVNPTGP